MPEVRVRHQETWVLTVKTDFHVWDRATLVRFAEEATAKLADQSAQIEQLKDERRQAIDAVRDLLRNRPAQIRKQEQKP